MIKLEDLKNITKTITLTGESGVGKSSLAKRIHKESLLKNERFIQVNISSLSSTLFESEIFGHTKGSFTGAHQDKKGFLEEVGAGTLFLDEVSELTTELQCKLLTVLEEREFYKVGSSSMQRFKGRIIFASSIELEQLVKQKKMRFDFYQRIKTFNYKIPALREMPNLASLIQKSFEDKKVENQNFDINLSKNAFELLARYQFLGNYRELNSIMDYITTLKSGEVGPEDVPVIEVLSEVSNVDCYYQALESFERGFLHKKLQKYGYGINLTADNVNISKVTLISKIKKYGMNIKQLKIENMKAS